MARVIPTFAVIPSEGRPMLHDCIASVRDQVDHIIVVANGGYEGHDLSGVHVVGDAGADRNISRWWNIGLWVASEHARHESYEWDTLVLNDDVIMHPGSVARLSSELRRGSCPLAFPGHVNQVLTQPSLDRMAGWCFMLRGEPEIRVDEGLAWWYGDNDLDWRCRSLGGSAMVAGVETTHRDPNGYTNRVPELGRQAGLDRSVFLAKWGRLPH